MNLSPCSFKNKSRCPETAITCLGHREFFIRLKVCRKLLYGNILDKCFYGFVGGQSQLPVHISRSSVPLFRTLPEQSLIISQEGRTLHLRLMSEDSVSLLSKFFRREWYCHFYMVYLPLHPCTTIHPESGRLQPGLHRGIPCAFRADRPGRPPHRSGAV